MLCWLSLSQVSWALARVKGHGGSPILRARERLRVTSDLALNHWELPLLQLYSSWIVKFSKVYKKMCLVSLWPWSTDLDICRWGQTSLLDILMIIILKILKIKIIASMTEWSGNENWMQLHLYNEFTILPWAKCQVTHPQYKERL